MDTLQDERGHLLRSARLMSKERSISLYGGSLSAKCTLKNLFGQDEEILLITAKDRSLAAAQAEDFVPLRAAGLDQAVRLEALPDQKLENELACRRVEPFAPLPAAEALLHSQLPARYVYQAVPEALLAVASTAQGAERLYEVYGDQVLLVSYARPGLPLAKNLAAALASAAERQFEGAILLGNGLITCADDPEQACQRMLKLAAQAEKYLADRKAWRLEVGYPPNALPSIGSELASLRKAVSDRAGFPMILKLDEDPLSRAYSQRSDLELIAAAGLALPAHAVVARPFPLVGREPEEFGARYKAWFQQVFPGQALESPDLAPRVILDPQWGMLTAGRSAQEADLAEELYRLQIRTFLRAEALGGYQSASVEAALEAEYGQAGLSTRPADGKAGMFAGEIALVTGGASGIGKACVESLLARGAAVATMDINPTVAALFDRPDYLGLLCDLTDENAVLQAFEQLARRFGGLDMLILNAGIFPSGCRIESLSLSEWQRVMRINLDSNLVLMREAYPLLKCSPKGGRVVVNASKNVLAPGAGAAAYSASKAAVTQMARVAALEWGKDRIRVNMVHPDAVFDTGIWTPEVLEARAKYYGLTVQQYKTRNVLGVELNSHTIGELAAEMLGPLFEKITGAQIPVDGGSDRVI